MEKLAKKIGLTIKSQVIDRNPHNPDWTEETHYKVTLERRNPHRQLTTVFSMGFAHTSPPTAGEVLSCLITEATSVLNANSFEDWASDFGYDPDSRKAEAAYRACGKISKQVKRFLGDNWAEGL